MVVKSCKKRLVLIIALQISRLCFPQELNYWQNLIQTAFQNSSSVNDIKKDYISTVINKKQYEHMWLPNFQVGLQTSFNASRGDGLYVLNQASDSAITWIASPSLGFSINQRLPGQGSVSLGLGYGFNYSIDRKAFIQWPQIQLSLNQKLGRGAFGITKNPEYQLINEQMTYYTDMYKRNLDYEIQNIIAIIQRADILLAQEKYYASLVDEYKSELETSRKKNLSGMQSSLETHYANHQHSEAQNNLNNIVYQKNLVENELAVLIPDFKLDDLDKARNELKNIILQIYNEIEKNPESIEKNFDSKLYSSIQKQYLLQYQYSETSYVPELFLTTSLNPDSNFNAYYSDWFKSFRVFKETPYPIDFSVTIGIRQNFELPKAGKLRKEMFELNKSVMEKDYSTMLENQKRELKILVEQITLDNIYLGTLESEIFTEQSFREKRKGLLEKHIITQDEFLQSETMYFRIYMDYINTFWRMLGNQIFVIGICSQDTILLNTLSGDIYDF